MKKWLKKGNEVEFTGGNYRGLTGVVVDTDYESTHPRAIYGVWITVSLSNGATGYIEKSEHVKKLN